MSDGVQDAAFNLIYSFESLKNPHNWAGNDANFQGKLFCIYLREQSPHDPNLKALSS